MAQVKDSALKRAPVLHALVMAQSFDEKDEVVPRSDAGKKFHIKRTLEDNLPALNRHRTGCQRQTEM